MTTTSQVPLTDLDKQRFNAWFEYDSRLPDLANELETNVLELAEWAKQPHIAERLDAVATIARQRHATLRAEAQHAATARLLRIVRFCDHDEIARRAADRLLRSLPAGERPLDDEPQRPTDPADPTDKDVHATQPASRPLPAIPLPSPRTPAIDARPSAPPDQPLRAPTPAPPPAPPSVSELTLAVPSPITDELVAAVLDAAQAQGLDADDLEDPGVLEDLLDDLNLSVDVDDLQDALDDALLDRDAADFEATHGIPITHPAIRQAIADFRIDEIPTIAAALRANAPP